MNNLLLGFIIGFIIGLAIIWLIITICHFCEKG